MKAFLLSALALGLAAASRDLNVTAFKEDAAIAGHDTALFASDVYGNATEFANKTLTAANKMMAVNMSQPYWMCHGYPCPEYTVDATINASANGTAGYEIRTYNKSAWVTTCMNDTNFAWALAKGRVGLYSYMKGGNKGGHKLPISAPLVVRMTPNQAFSGNASAWSLSSNFTLAMFLSNQTAAAAPVPKSGSLHLTSFEEGLLYVYSFTGYATTSSIKANAAKLAAALSADGHTFDASSFLFAQYDSPARVRHRHNEIWVTASGHDDAFVETA